MRGQQLSLIGLALVLTSGSAVAQVKSTGAYDVARAEQLMKQAEEVSSLSKHNERAKLFEQASKLFPPSDHRSLYAQRQAAFSWYYMGQTAHAQTMLEAVAVRAEEHGRLDVAGDAYISALVIATERGDRSEARRLMDRVVVLASTPAMPEDKRLEMLQRVAQPLATLASKGPR